MHLRHPEMHIAIDSLLLIFTLELKFLHAEMFPYKDSEILTFHSSVCAPKKEITLAGFVNISLTLVINTSMERSSRELQHWNWKILFIFPSTIS